MGKKRAIGLLTKYSAIWLKSDLTSGKSSRADVFKNEPLSPEEIFDVIALECYTFA